MQNLDLDSGVLAGANTLLISGVLRWTGGTMSGSGMTRILPGAELNFEGESDKFLMQRMLVNSGMICIGSTGDIWLGEGSTVKNDDQGVFDWEVDSVIRYSGGATPLLVNAGLFRKSAGIGTSSISAGVEFSNSGTVEVRSGTLDLGSAFTNFDPLTGTLMDGRYWVAGTLRFTGARILINAADLVLDGSAAAIVDESGSDALANLATNAASGSFTIESGRNFTPGGTFASAGTLIIGYGSTFTANAAAGGTLMILAGTLSGSGTIIGNVVNSGQIHPVDSLTILGDYTQTSSGTLMINIGDSGRTTFDQLVISGMALLDGTLTVTVTNGFLPNIDDRFQILVFGSRSGDFAVENGLDLGGGLRLDPQYDSTSLTLVTT
jgi:hypothetical protein